MLRCCVGVLCEMKKQIPYIKPIYSMSRVLTQNKTPNHQSCCENMLNYLKAEKVGFICHSMNDIQRAIPYSGNIICNTQNRTRHDIMVSKSVNICEFIVSNIAELRLIHEHHPCASFRINTSISYEGVATSKKMIDYIWQHKCLYNGLMYDIGKFSNGMIPPPMYSHKIAIDYLLRNIIDYSSQIGIQTHSIHIGENVGYDDNTSRGCRSDNIAFITPRQIFDLHHILTETRMLAKLDKSGIALQATFGGLDDVDDI